MGADATHTGTPIAVTGLLVTPMHGGNQVFPQDIHLIYSTEDKDRIDGHASIDTDIKPGANDK